MNWVPPVQVQVLEQVLGQVPAVWDVWHVLWAVELPSLWLEAVAVQVAHHSPDSTMWVLGIVV